MNTQEIIAALDSEISRLHRVRELLVGQPAVRRGRPKGSSNKTQGASVKFDPSEFATPKRTMSPEGKERIAAAQRARWARQNAGATKKAATKTAPAKSARKASGSKKASKAGAADSGAPKRKVGRPAKAAGSTPAKAASEQTSSATS